MWELEGIRNRSPIYTPSLSLVSGCRFWFTPNPEILHLGGCSQARDVYGEYLSRTEYRGGQFLSSDSGGIECWRLGPRADWTLGVWVEPWQWQSTIAVVVAGDGTQGLAHFKTESANHITRPINLWICKSVSLTYSMYKLTSRFSMERNSELKNGSISSIV